MARNADESSCPPGERGVESRGPGPDLPPPIPLLAMNGSLDRLPHDAAVRAAVELLCRGSPIIRTGSACDLSCVYCCVGADGPPLQPEASLCRLVDGLARLGHRGIGYMGGEPAIHPAFERVVRHAKSRGFTCQMLCTNGIKLHDGDFAARLFDAGINAVCTSLDAFDPKVQEPLYGGRASLSKALAGLHHALAAPPVEVLVSAVITAQNARLLPGYMEEVDKLQVRYQKPVGVMLCVLQKPAREGPEQRALTLSMPEAAKLTVKALQRACKVGVAAFTFGFPPCLLPGHEQHVAELYAAEWKVDIDSGTVERSQLRDAAAYWSKCAICPHGLYCPGVLEQYADAKVQSLVAAWEPVASEEARP
ncbi:MAG: radical SAM protein [Deltaproteobacteria bacterium]|nr:radical SAM protein [Deltaproteobacteria bacterium]